jgi:hypothetical protein
VSAGCAVRFALKLAITAAAALLTVSANPPTRRTNADGESSAASFGSQIATVALRARLAIFEYPTIE